MGASSMRLEQTQLLHPTVLTDQRGFFMESYNERTMADLGIDARFVQDNHSYSVSDVLRGLHYQFERPQGKLIRALCGEILDVVVDLRRNSPSFGKWVSENLSGENHIMLWLPVGVAHGFRVLSKNAHVLYKATEFYDPSSERTIIWNDSDLNIDWQLKSAPIVSEKDARGINFCKAPKFN
jgi:dTDP-4-dehydrorhamnose 3,5-epimerase